MFSDREKLIFVMELRQCFSAKRIPVFVLLMLAAIFLVVQESEVSPLVVVFLTVFAILEWQFNNILFRSPHELEALSLFPVSWRRIVLVKNLATILLTGIVTILVSITVLYFSPKPFDIRHIHESFLYASTIIFPLLHVGNTESLRSPRKSGRWHIDDLVQAVGMLLFVVVLSLPYIVLTVIVRLPILNVLYATGMAWYWYRYSLPNIALKIEQQKTLLCTTL
ncbi:MAG: hypothetical protein KF749_15225 [Bacteroidetes bacterium]|nr:hypothetical protein [Bacteroidota bacterium]MCW5897291.1 hypothetical protein [Bacteroidota bacterium]